MLHNLLHFPIAFQADTRFLAIMLIPVVAIAMGGIVAVFAMHFHNVRRQMWHDTARVALEKGQPLPPMEDDSGLDSPRVNHVTRGGSDIRRGLVLIGVGAGLFIFFQMIGAQQVSGVGAIPGFIGVALLLYALLAHLFSTKSSRPSDRPPHS